MYAYSSFCLSSLLVSICVRHPAPRRILRAMSNMSSVDRHPDLLDRDQAVLVVVDVQERFVDHIFEFDAMVDVIDKAIDGAQQLGLPILVTEQYPAGLGRTVKKLTDRLAGSAVFEKTRFSSAGSADFISSLAALKRRQVLLCGIETHVCISQTAHDLIARGYDVHLIEDGISSRHFENKTIGLKKIYKAGAIPSSLEMAMFELLQDARADKFKAIQALIK